LGKKKSLGGRFATLVGQRQGGFIAESYEEKSAKSLIEEKKNGISQRGEGQKASGKGKLETFDMGTIQALGKKS